MNEAEIEALLEDLRLVSAAQSAHGKYWMLSFSESGRTLLERLEELKSYERSLESIKHVVESLNGELDHVHADFLDSSHALQSIINESSDLFASTIASLHGEVRHELQATQAHFDDTLSDSTEKVKHSLEHGENEAMAALKAVASHLEKAKHACDQMKSVVNSTIGRLADPLEGIERMVTPLQPILAVLEEVM